MYIDQYQDQLLIMQPLYDVLTIPRMSKKKISDIDVH